MSLKWVESEPLEGTSETYRETREAFENRGFFVLAVQPKSLNQLLKEERELFGYVNPSTNLREIVPPIMEVAINPTQVAILRSNEKTLDAQLEITEKYSRQLQKATGFEGIEAVLTHASVYAQLDIAFQKQRGKKLFTDLFARTIDETTGPNVAYVGRHRVDDPLKVYDWYRGGGYPGVFAVPVVVLPPRK